MENNIEDNIRRWKETPYSKIGRANIGKMSIFLKLLQIFNIISIKTEITFLTKLEKAILNFI